MTNEHSGATPSLLAVGQLFLDLVFAELAALPQPGHEVWTPAFGSGPGGIANQAIAAARLGARVAVAAAVGDDEFSRLCLNQLSAEGIDTATVQQVPGWRLPVTASIAHGGERAMITGGTPAPLGADALLGATPPAARTAVAQLETTPAHWLEAATDTSVYATVGWDATEAWDAALLDQLEHCAAFQPNAAEAMAYTRRSDPADAAHVLAQSVPLVVVTLGADGLIAVDSANGVELARPALRVDAVDATGAGDVFGAALAISEIPDWTLTERLDFAALVAGITVSSPGGAASAPTAAELVPWLDAHCHAAEPGRFDFVRRDFAPDAPSPFLP